jgi:hypothetical protein
MRVRHAWGSCGGELPYDGCCVIAAAAALYIICVWLHAMRLTEVCVCIAEQCPA